MRRVDLVGPKGYVHGWKFVGVPGETPHEELLSARAHFRKTYPAGHPERLKAERAVRQSRKLGSPPESDWKAKVEKLAVPDSVVANAMQNVHDRGIREDAPDGGKAFWKEVHGEASQYEPPAEEKSASSPEERFAAAERSGIKGTKDLRRPGNIARAVEKREYKNGDAWVVKDTTAAEVERSHLAAKIAHVIGAPTPETVRDPQDPKRFYQTFGSGKTLSEHLGGAVPRQKDRYTQLQAQGAETRRIFDSPEGKRITLLDLLTNNQDRNETNSLLDSNGKLTAIDNGMTWRSLDHTTATMPPSDRAGRESLSPSEFTKSQLDTWTAELKQLAHDLSLTDSQRTLLALTLRTFRHWRDGTHAKGWGRNTTDIPVKFRADSLLSSMSAKVAKSAPAITSAATIIPAKPFQRTPVVITDAELKKELG